MTFSSCMILINDFEDLPYKGHQVFKMPLRIYKTSILFYCNKVWGYLTKTFKLVVRAIVLHQKHGEYDLLIDELMLMEIVGIGFGGGQNIICYDDYLN